MGTGSTDYRQQVNTALQQANLPKSPIAQQYSGMLNQAAPYVATALGNAQNLGNSLIGVNGTTPYNTGMPQVGGGGISNFNPWQLQPNFGLGGGWQGFNPSTVPNFSQTTQQTNQNFQGNQTGITNQQGTWNIPQTPILPQNPSNPPQLSPNNPPAPPQTPPPPPPGGTNPLTPPQTPNYNTGPSNGITSSNPNYNNLLTQWQQSLAGNPAAQQLLQLNPGGQFAQPTGFFPNGGAYYLGGQPLNGMMAPNAIFLNNPSGSGWLGSYQPVSQALQGAITPSSSGLPSSAGGPSYNMVPPNGPGSGNPIPPANGGVDSGGTSTGSQTGSGTTTTTTTQMGGGSETGNVQNIPQFNTYGMGNITSGFNGVTPSLSINPATLAYPNINSAYLPNQDPTSLFRLWQNYQGSPINQYNPSQQLLSSPQFNQQINQANLQGIPGLQNAIQDYMGNNYGADLASQAANQMQGPINWNTQVNAPQVNGQNIAATGNVTPAQSQSVSNGLNSSNLDLNPFSAISGVPSIQNQSIQNPNAAQFNFNPQQVQAGFNPQQANLSSVQGPVNVADNSYFNAIQDALNRQMQIGSANLNEQFNAGGTSRGTPNAFAQSQFQATAIPQLAQSLGNAAQQMISNQLQQRQQEQQGLLSNAEMANQYGLGGAQLGANTALQNVANQMASQQFGTTTQLQNNAQALQAQLANQSANLASQQSNQQTGFNVQQANQAALLQQAQLGNQSQLQLNQQNLANQQQNVQNYLQANQLNNQFGLQNAAQQLAAQQSNQGTNLAAQQSNQQAGVTQREQDIQQQQAYAQMNLQRQQALGGLGTGLQGLYYNNLNNLMNTQTQMQGQGMQNYYNQIQAQLQQAGLQSGLANQAGNLGLGYNQLGQQMGLDYAGLNSQNALGLLGIQPQYANAMNSAINNQNQLYNNLSQFNSGQQNQYNLALAGLNQQAMQQMLQNQFAGLSSLFQGGLGLAAAGIPGGSANVNVGAQSQPTALGYMNGLGNLFQGIGSMMR